MKQECKMKTFKVQVVRKIQASTSRLSYTIVTVRNLADRNDGSRRLEGTAVG